MKAAALVLLALALAGCADFPEPSAPAQKTGDGDSPLAGTGDSGARQAAGAVPPAPPAKPGRPALDGEALVGLTTAEAWELLAAPSDTAKESPATVWTYEHAGCRLELFFYFDLESEQQRTLAYDLDAGGEAIGSTRFCLQELAERGAAQNAANGPSAAVAGRRSDTAEPGAGGAQSGEETSE